MKKIVLFIISVFTLVFSINNVFAYDIPLNNKEVSKIIVSQTTYIPHGIQGLGDVELTPSITSVSSDLINNYSSELWFQTVSFTRDVNLLINNQVVYENIKVIQILHDFYENYSSYRIYIYAYDSNNALIGEMYTNASATWLFTYVISSDPYSQGYIAGETNGYIKGKTEGFELGINDVTNNQKNYNLGYNTGYELGLTSEIDWFNWAFTFITLPVRILNVEVLPNIKIGYFALFTLMTGIISWFFFIVGKGKGKK